MSIMTTKTFCKNSKVTIIWLNLRVSVFFLILFYVNIENDTWKIKTVSSGVFTQDLRKNS